MSHIFQHTADFPISERRTQLRQRVLLSCLELGDDNGGIVLNISEGGVALQAIAELVDDELPRLRFQFSQFQSWVEAKGQIAWRSDSGKMVGVKFVDLLAEDRHKIRAWILSTQEERCFEKNSVPREEPEFTDAIPIPQPQKSERQLQKQRPTLISAMLPGPDAFNALATSTNSVGMRTEDSTLVFAENVPALSYPKAQYGRRGKEHGQASEFHKGLWVVGFLLTAVLVSFVVFEKHHFSKIKYGPQRNEAISAAELPVSASKDSPKPVSPPDLKPASDIPRFVLQVGAMAHEENAVTLAESLRQKNFPAFVLQPEARHLYLVLVGPYDADNTARVKRELEGQNSTAIRTEWKTPSSGAVLGETTQNP